MDDLDALKKAAAEKSAWLAQELQGLRTGRASPALLDPVALEVYGSRMKLNQIAAISVEDARTLYVNPWDKEHVKPIEKAITVADLGVSVGSDAIGVRVSFPELTTERRAQLVKLVNAKLEEARVALRSARAKAITELEKSDLGEDDERRIKAEMQKVVDDANANLEKIAEKKEQELAA